MDSISFKDALAEMREHKIFSIKFVSYDKKRKTGGTIKYFPQVKIIQKKKANSTLETQKSTTTKRTNSFENATRTIKVFVDGVESSTTRKFHIFLMLEFNGKKVYL